MRVLLVEEEPDVLRIATMFMQDEGFVVDAFDHHRTVLSKVRSSNYDIIILNAGPDAPDLSDELRREKPETPVLILTNRGALNQCPETVERAANDRLLKPFTRSELVDRVRRLARRPVAAIERRIEIGPISIDTDVRKVMVDGKYIELRQKEYCLLELLAIHRGELVTRREICEHLFDGYDPSHSNLIEVYVSCIRRKIGAGMIKTSRGIGYRMNTNRDSQ